MLQNFMVITYYLYNKIQELIKISFQVYYLAKNIIINCLDQVLEKTGGLSLHFNNH